MNLGLYIVLTMPMVTKSSRPYVRVTGLGAPGKLDRLMLRFFWKRVYCMCEPLAPLQCHSKKPMHHKENCHLAPVPFMIQQSVPIIMTN